MPPPVVDYPYTGRYRRAFLNGLVGRDNYTIISFDLDTLSTSEGNAAAMAALDDPDLSLAYMSDTKLTCLWIHNYPGWLNFCRQLGVSISNSAKIAKRLTVMTRLTYLAIFKRPDEIRMKAVDPGSFSDYDVEPHIQSRFLDGANVISQELLEEMITAGSNEIDAIFASSCDSKCSTPCDYHGRGNPWAKTVINRGIDRAGSFSLRILSPQGQIKGDTLVVPSKQIGGYDVLYCKENLKTETRTDFVFVLCEPHPGIRRHTFSPDEPAPPPVWTDDQTMSWLGQWLYPHEQITAWLQDFAERTYEEIAQGKYPEFFTNTLKRSDEQTTITQFQEQALRWEEEGLGLKQSIFLQERIGQGAVNQLSNKRHWPVACAMYVHVATDSWLHMAGFVDPETGEHPWPFEDPQTPRGTVWYHPETGRLVYNDLDFAELYDRHGGWDLDDSVKAHFRTVKSRRKVIIVRSPNSYGEYDVKDYTEGTYAPTWTRADGVTIAFPPTDDNVEPPDYLEDLDITYKRRSLSSTQTKRVPYTKDVVRNAVKMARRYRGVLGRRLNADMAYFASTSTYRRNQLCPVEAIVDACTQEQTEEAIELINADTEAIITELRVKNITVDRTLWEQRVKRFFKDMSYNYGEWTELAVVHDSLCALYRRKYNEIAQSAQQHIEPDVFDLGRAYATNGNRLVQAYYELVRSMSRSEDESRTSFYHRVNEMLCANFVGVPEQTIYDNVLAMARYVYTHKRGDEYKDTPLFQTGRRVVDPSIFDYYLRAINFYGIGDPQWARTWTCPDCKTRHTYTDNVEYQEACVRKACHECFTHPNL